MDEHRSAALSTGAARLRRLSSLLGRAADPVLSRVLAARSSFSHEFPFSCLCRRVTRAVDDSLTDNAPFCANHQ